MRTWVLHWFQDLRDEHAAGATRTSEVFSEARVTGPKTSEVRVAGVRMGAEAEEAKVAVQSELKEQGEWVRE